MNTRNYSLTNEDRKVLTALVNPKYPRGRRSVEGIATETKLDEGMVVAVLSSEHHSAYITKHERLELEEEGVEVKPAFYSMSFPAFIINVI